MTSQVNMKIRGRIFSFIIILLISTFRNSPSGNQSMGVIYKTPVFNGGDGSHYYGQVNVTQIEWERGKQYTLTILSVATLKRSILLTH